MSKKENLINSFTTWDPSFIDPPSGDLTIYEDYILSHVKFSLVIKTLKLRPERCTTGKYTHRMICPFKFHKNGRERTPSFRFNDNKNSFTCFGCLESGNILKFLQLYCGGDEQYNLKRLASIAGLIKDGALYIPDNYIVAEKEHVAETNYNIIFKAGLILRDYLLKIYKTDKYDKECEWVDGVFIKMDKYFSSLDETDLEAATKVYKKIEEAIRKRK